MTEQKIKHFFVTGGTGFCGTHLIKILIEQGHSVTALSRRRNGMETDILDVVPQEIFDKIKWVHGDLTDIDSLRKVFANDKLDGVFHLAAMSLPPQSFIDPLGTFQTNIIGTANLARVVEEIHGTSCKFMFCSTSEVYGNIGKTGVQIKETEKMHPNNPYGVSKAASELYLQERFMNDKMGGFITRAFSHSGPRRGKNFSISSDAYQIAGFILDSERRKKENLPSVEYELKVGNLQTTRCLLHVKDIAEVYVSLMLNPKSSGKVFNVCATAHHKMEYFTDVLIKLSELKIVKKIHEPFYRKNDILFQHGDITALKNLTKWKPKYTVEETLADLLEYWLIKLAQV